MKVMILAGGFGTRIGEESRLRPKPMIEVGGEPVLWHLMRYFSAYGHREFIVCCGYLGHVIKEYFLHYRMHRSSVTFDFAREGEMTLHGCAAEPWRVTLADTGTGTLTGSRVRKAATFTDGEPFFLTYGDGLADVDLNALLAFHRLSGAEATLTAVQPGGRFGALEIDDNRRVRAFREKAPEDGGWINGGIRTVLTAAGEKGALMYAMGIAAATAIDLGGPINKAAGFVAFSFTTDHVLPVTARSIAIVIPPIGLGLATIIDRRLTGKRLFNAQLYPQGKTAMFLAFMGISEGAIPFALESPITAIPSYMVGAIVGSTAAVWLGAVQWFPESAIWAWPLVTNLGVYMAGIALGAVITALMVVFLRLMMFRKGKLLIDSL